jgi:phosphoribosylanthranilate isomerase
MAEQAVKAGADLIGIVFHPLSPRCVSFDQAAAVSAATKRAGGLPVAVFVDHTAADMHYLCEMADIHVVQLHGKASRAQHHLLPKTYQRIYVQNVSSEGALQIEDGLAFLYPDRDFILIDHEEPGRGNAIDRKKIKYTLPFPWILAGGLSSRNIVSAISELQPDGVDVSSGVESSLGIKDISLIQEFISLIRE